MSHLEILDLVVGIIFIFFLLSVISNSIVEVIITISRARAKLLEEWLKTIFKENVQIADGTSIPLGQAIMDHLSVSGITTPGTSPSYIDAKNFTSALIEKVTYDPTNPKSVAKDLQSIITHLENTTALPTELKRTFISHAIEAQQSYATLSVKTVGEIEMFKSKIENWYDSSTERLAGALKQKHTRKITFWLALIITVGMNVDTISLAQYLYSNPEARASLAAEAYATAKDSTITAKIESMKADSINLKDSITLEEVKNELNSRALDIKKASATLSEGIPLGWNKAEFILFQHNNPSINYYCCPVGFILSKLPGWVLTIFAIMMGSPFWFDLLNKISNLRGTGPKPEAKSTEDKK